MALQDIYRRVAGAALASELRDWRTGAAPGDALRIAGAAGSLPAFLLRALLDEDGPSGNGQPVPLLAVTPDEDAAAYLRSDLDALLGEKSAAAVLHFPATGQTPYDDEQIASSAPLTARADVLQQLTGGFGGIVVTSAEALFEKVPPPEGVQQDTLRIERGQTLAPERLVERLNGQGFSRVEFVEEPGHLARRGGILDVFPFSGEYPVRIEFFGDEIDGLREFDPHTQRSVSRLTETRLVPNLEREDEEGESGPRVPFFDYLPDAALAATFDEERLLEEAAERFADAEKRHAEALGERENDGEPLPAPEARYLPAGALQTQIERPPRLLFGTFTGDVEAETLEANAHS
ncbi:MAG: transcription-repair coupling factor, partial [Bacteroidetes bacterium QH_8_67_23]